MTEIKIAQAWGWIGSDGLYPAWTGSADAVTKPVIVVHGLTEADLREMLERRGECEWHGVLRGGLNCLQRQSRKQRECEL
jgi:hypothetical protein